MSFQSYCYKGVSLPWLLIKTAVCEKSLFCSKIHCDECKKMSEQNI